MSNNSSYDQLIDRIESYIKKYYVNQALKGLIISATLSLISFLVLISYVYLSEPDSIIRTALFFGYVTFLAITVGFYVINPLLRMNKLGKRLSQEDAAANIGDHFPEVQDQLLNLLQLKSSTHSSIELLEASIEQKTKELSPFDFSSVVQFKENQQYLKYLLIPFIVGGGIVLVNPDVIEEGTNQIVQYNQEFEKRSPFRFVLKTKELETFQHDDLLVELEIEGEEIPANIFIHVDGYKYAVQKKNKTNCFYTFKNLNKATSFQFSANDYFSKPYHIKVLPKPILKNFYIDIEYPKYLGKLADRLNNIGDLVIPEGTKVSWNFRTLNTEQVKIQVGDSIVLTDKVDDYQFKGEYQFTVTSTYEIVQTNEFVKELSPIVYYAKVIKDQYPQISVNTFQDSITNEYLFFTGQIMDDYGFSALTFNYKSKKASKYTSERLEFNRGTTKDQLVHTFDVGKLNLKAGESIQYYFEVWDNDDLHNFKSTRSTLLTHKIPSKSEQKDIVTKKSDDIKQKIEQTIQQSLANKKQVEDLKNMLLQKQSISWDDKQQLQELMKEHQQLKNELKQIAEKNKELNERNKNLNEQDDEIAKKQEKLQKMFEEVLDDEVKKLLDEIEALMDKMNKNDAMENFDDLELSNEEISQELDKMLELFKELEFQQKMDQAVQDLQDLAKEQKELAEDKEFNDEEQEKLNEEFEQLKKDLDQLDELNEALEKKKDLDTKQEQQESISEKMDQAAQELQQQKKSGKKKQQELQQQMEQMAQQMEQQQQQMEQQQMAEDYETIRQLLDNIITLSFIQEELILEAKSVLRNSDEFVALVQKQYNLKDDYVIVKDSLTALSKRVFELESFITKELSDLGQSIDASIDYLEKRKVSNAYVKQQYSMTSLNNLALMLNESLEQMQQQMSMQMQGKQNCQKPGKSGKGKGQKSMANMRKLQQELGKQLEEMKKGSEKMGRNGMSKGFAKMAQKQAQIRQMMEELNNELNKDGKKSLGDLEKLLDEMEQNEKDIVNKRLDEELIRRQQYITTRMLQAEKAIKERELSEEREAEQATDYELLLPKSFEKYKQMKEKQLELYKTVPPSLKPFYRQLVEDYFNKISL